MISDVSTHLIRHSGMLCRLGYQQLLTASKYLFHWPKMFNKTTFGFNHIDNLMDFGLACSQVNAAVLGC
jgi:hypothetical protein